ncbi:MAG: oligosaccharide flippase family protein [Campylobacterota bacterium]|nr:oligosaccharide flippase family protein [Campylobacterota bacterium]
MLSKLKPKSEFSRNVLTLMTGTTIAQAIPIAISPILTRIYTPEDFGIFALFISIVSIMAVVSTGKYEMSLILPKKDTFAYQLLIFSGIIALISSIIYISSVVLIDTFYSIDAIYYLLPFTVLFIGLNNTFDKYNNRVKNYKLMSYQRLIKTTIESIVSVFFMILFSIKTGLIWGFVLGYLVSNLTMLYINIKSFQKKAFIISKSKMKILAKKYINFPKYNMPHAMLNTVSANAPIFLIPIFYGNATLGLYAFGLKIVQAPLGLLSASIFNVLGQKMAEEYAKGNEILTIYKTMLKKLSLVAIAMIPFFIFADDIFAFVFGSEWREAGDYIQILSPWILLIFIGAPLSTIAHIYNQQRKALTIEVISIVVKLLILVLFGSLASVENTLLALSIFSSCVILYSLSWYFSLVKKDVRNNE